MHRIFFTIWLGLLGPLACNSPAGTGPPPGGWANHAPTVVEQVIDRGDKQLLAVKQGELKTWVQVPNVSAKIGDYVLLGAGTARHDVDIPEIAQRASVVVDIDHVQVADADTAQKVASAKVPAHAVAIGTVYAELDQRADATIVVFGTVIKSTPAVGAVWVHIQDGTGDPDAGTHDLTIKTQVPATVGQRVAYSGVLRKDVELGFGYAYRALVEEAVLVE
ncbi:MAG: hypothetical protein AB8H79_19405 [Myxococcota bacterium]